MPRPPWEIPASLSPLLFLLLAGGALALQGAALGDLEADAPPEAMADAINARQGLAGGFVAAATLAGLSLLVLADTLARRLPRLPWLPRAAGALWAMLWLAAATFGYAAIDLAGHFGHAAGAKTAMYASYAFVTSPAGVALAGVLVLGVARAARGAEGWPRWYARFSGACGALILLGGATLALSFAGMLGLLALPLWLLVTAVVLPLAARRPVGERALTPS